MRTFTFTLMRREFKLATAANSVSASAIIISFFRDATASAPTWTDVNTTNSCIQYSTNVATVTGGSEIYSFGVAAANMQTVDLSGLDMFLAPGETLTMAARFTLSGAGKNADVSVSISWIEDN